VFGGGGGGGGKTLHYEGKGKGGILFGGLCGERSQSQEECKKRIGKDGPTLINLLRWYYRNCRTKQKKGP